MCMGGAGGMLSAVVGAMGAVAEYNAQVEDFNNQERMWKENYGNSLAAGREEQVAIQTKAFQEQQVTSQKVEEYSREGAQAAAVAEVSAASSGVSGNGVSDLIRGIWGGAARNRYWAKENAAITAQQLTQELKATNTRMMNRINSVQRPRPPDPSGAMLKIMGGFVGAIGGMA